MEYSAPLVNADGGETIPLSGRGGGGGPCRGPRGMGLARRDQQGRQGVRGGRWKGNAFGQRAQVAASRLRVAERGKVAFFGQKLHTLHILLIFGAYFEGFPRFSRRIFYPFLHIFRMFSG